MMTVHSISLIRRLQDLERQIADAPRYRDMLTVALHRQDRGAVLRTSMDAERHLRVMAVTTADLKGQVVPADGLGTVLESLSELVLRAVRLVVLTEMGTLREVVREPFARSRSRALLREPLRVIEDVTSCVGGELDRITQLWSASRGTQSVARANYRAALRAAHAAMRHMSHGSELACFLRRGLITSDWPALQETCSRIVAALAIEIDVEPDLPLLVHSRPLRDAVVEREP